MILVVGASDRALWTAARSAREGHEVRVLRPAAVDSHVPWGLHATLDRPVWPATVPFPVTRGAWDRRGPRRRLRDRLVERLLPVSWWTPADDLATLRRQARELVVDAGGDVLDDVILEGLESEHGKLSAVTTEHGRERFDRLYADVSPVTLAAWLDLPSPVDLADAAQVSFRWDRATPWDLNLSADLPFHRLTRPGQLPGERSLGDLATAWCRVQPGTSDVDLAESVRAALAPFGKVGEEAIIQRVAAAADPIPRGLLTLADARGVQIVGHTAA